MINFHNQVPSVYTSASRDFQYLSWLINIVLNSVKHNVDDLYNLPDTGADPKLTELLALTLGFKIKRNYDQKQLAALVAILPSILKYKGTIKAVTMVVDALLTASGSLGASSCEVKGTLLEVVLPKDLIDTTLFIDLLDYILPAGMTCRIVRKTQAKQALDNIRVRHSDVRHYEVYDDLGWDTKQSTGLSGLFDIVDLKTDSVNILTPDTYSTANFKQVDEGFTLNAGLLDNTVIPVIPGEDRTSLQVVDLLSTENEIDETTNEPKHLALYAIGEVKLKVEDIAQES